MFFIFFSTLGKNESTNENKSYFRPHQKSLLSSATNVRQGLKHKLLSKVISRPFYLDAIAYKRASLSAVYSW